MAASFTSYLFIIFLIPLLVNIVASTLESRLKMSYSPFSKLFLDPLITG